MPVLLAILFATAIIYDTDDAPGQIELAAPFDDVKPLIPAPPLI